MSLKSILDPILLDDIEGLLPDIEELDNELDEEDDDEGWYNDLEKAAIV